MDIKQYNFINFSRLTLQGVASKNSYLIHFHAGIQKTRNFWNVLPVGFSTKTRSLTAAPVKYPKPLNDVKNNFISITEEFPIINQKLSLLTDYLNHIRNFIFKIIDKELTVISEERVERETEEKIARQHAVEQLRLESELHKLRLEIESIRSNVRRTSYAEDPKTSSNYRISIGRAEEHARETSPAVLMSEATIPATTPIKEEMGIDDLRAIHVKGEQEMVNAVIYTSAQMPVVRADIAEGQSINNRGSIKITSAFGEHEMENSQLVRNPAILREPSKEEGIINSVNSKSVCSREVITDLLHETCTRSFLNVPNGDLVAEKINTSKVQTNGQGIKERKRKVALYVDSLHSENNFILSGSVIECWKSNVITFLNDGDKHVNNQFQTFGISAILPNIAITLKRRGNITDFVIIRKTLSFLDGVRVVSTMGTTPIWDIDSLVKIMCIMPEINVAKSEVA
ncbi:hypothetical protein TNCV_4098071 [Trichonephila clavipes]|nr:hypothetical protein TNCV_4098071 [Trichonephila clavipes]